MLGLSPRTPKFVRRYGDLGPAIAAAIEGYATDVRHQEHHRLLDGVKELRAAARGRGQRHNTPALDRLSRQVAHVTGHRVQHLVIVDLFASQVGDHGALQFGCNHMHMHRPHLTETPAAPNRLVNLFKAVGKAHEGHAGAMSVMHAVPSDRRLGHEDRRLAQLKPYQPLDLCRHRIGSLDLLGAKMREPPLDQVRLRVEVAPDQPRLPRLRFDQANRGANAIFR